MKETYQKPEAKIVVFQEGQQITTNQENPGSMIVE